jgi:hypothetical protein
MYDRWRGISSLNSGAKSSRSQSASVQANLLSGIGHNADSPRASTRCDNPLGRQCDGGDGIGKHKSGFSFS